MSRLRKIIKLGLIITMLWMPVLVSAADDPGNPPGGDNTLDNPVPFDDGVYFLVAVAVAYGLRIAYNRKKISVIAS